MAITALLLELAALYFQHVMLLQSCVLCIYERHALFGILSSELVGAFATKSPLRYTAIMLWIYSV
jgi:disulfide bond formation protein DsbB